MKVIIDPKLTDTLESIQLHPDRLFFCVHCNLNCARKGVTKDAQGNYSCIHCGKFVQDITETDHGRQLAAMLGM